MANYLWKKSLHICSMESYDRDGFTYSCCYSVQAINFTELLSFSSTPIIISFSRYQTSPKQLALSQDEYHVLREVDSREGNAVPHRMRFGVFRSHIVLAGGEEYGFPSTKVYVLETNPNLSSSRIQNKSKRARARARARAARAKARDNNPELQSEKAKAIPKAKASDDSFSVPQLRSEKCNPKLMEIQGKLYVIDISPRELRKDDFYAFFEVFDPQTGAWASLPNPPAPVFNGSDICLAVVGTNIFVHSDDSHVYSFDVAKPTWPWKKVLLRYVNDDQLEHGKLPLWDTLEVDLEEDNSKLLFYIRGNDIRVIHMNLIMSNRLLVLEYVAAMELDAKFDPFPSSFTHLGGLKFCLVLEDDSAPRGGPVYTLSGVIFTFEISLSKSAATSPACTLGDDDPYFRIIAASNGTSFSAKTLGWRPFEYHWHDQKVYPSLTQVIGLAVRPLSHQEHALCPSCQTYFVNTECLSRHLSIHPICRLVQQPVIQCKFCRWYFPKQELSAHFNTSMSCKSKFTYSSI